MDRREYNFFSIAMLPRSLYPVVPKERGENKKIDRFAVIG
jgi:hypothetical protein